MLGEAPSLNSVKVLLSKLNNLSKWPCGGLEGITRGS